MIIVPIKEGENIERALKKFKRKFEKTGAVREMRSRKNFEKPSVKKRMALQNYHKRQSFSRAVAFFCWPRPLPEGAMSLPVSCRRLFQLELYGNK